MTDPVTIGFAVSDIAGGLGYYRGRVPARMLRHAGRDAIVGGSIEAAIGGGPLALEEAVDLFGRGVDRGGATFAPHVLVLCGSFPHHVRAGGIRAAQEAGQAIVVDVDDPLWLPDWHPHHHREVEEARIEAVLQADIVTVGTEALAGMVAPYASRPPVIVPNAIDAADAFKRQGRTRARDGFVIGYRGPVEFHRGDLEQMGDALRTLHAQRPYVRFVHIGEDSPAPFAAATGVPLEAVTAVPLVPFDRYLELLAAIDVDVAVLPYSSTTYSSAKGAQGALEWVLAGVPFVSSWQPAILELARNVAGDGFRWGFADAPAEWFRYLDQLAARPAQREALWTVQMRACAPRVFGFESWLLQELEVPRERVTGQWLTAVDQARMMRA